MRTTEAEANRVLEDPAAPGTAAKAPTGGSARSVVALAALVFAGFAFLTVEIAPVGLLPAISADLDVSRSAVGLLVTWYALAVAVAAIPLTRLVGECHAVTCSQVCCWCSWPLPVCPW